MGTIRNIFISFLFFALIFKISGLYALDKTEIRNLKNFNSINVSAGIDLFLTMSQAEEVKVVANEDIISKIVTEVKEGTLHIYMKNSGWSGWGNKTQKVYVTIAVLKELKASSGSDVSSENVLKGDNIDIDVSSGSDVNVNLDYNTVELKTSSGSDAKIKGKAKNLKVNASSGSDIDADELESVNCKASASSGSDISVMVTGELTADASSGADIKYKGSPTSKNINESSGGEVSRR